MLIVAFAVMIPPTPGISRRALAADDDRPLGWSYSPSSFTQRIPIVALAFVGLFVSRYLAAYQIGHIDGLWDPFFGPGGAPVGKRQRGGGHLMGLEGLSHRRRRLRRLRLCSGHPGRRHRRPPALAHHAVDGAPVRAADHPARGDQRHLHHHPAASDRRALHALHRPGGGHRGPHALFDRRGAGDRPVPLARQEGGRAVLAHLLEGRAGAVGEPDAGAGPRPSGGRRAARLRHRRRQFSLDAGRQRGSRRS